MDVREWDAYVDRYGREPLMSFDGSPVESMMFPARCGCGQVYDLAAVEVTARYADCSMWTTPCCRRLTDDRPRGWNTGPGYTELNRRRSRRS